MTKKNRHPNASTMGATLVVAALLAACGAEQKTAEPPPVKDTAFGDMAAAMEQAREVEGTLQEHKEALDRTLQQSENASAE